jgi:hypothetical protein
VTGLGYADAASVGQSGTGMDQMPTVRVVNKISLNKILTMTEEEQRLLRSLASMCRQYLQVSDSDLLNHDCMCAGQDAIEILADYGLVELGMARSGTWTEAGKAFLSSSF